MRELTDGEASEVFGGESVRGTGTITYHDVADDDDFTIASVYSMRTYSNDGIMSFQTSEVVTITSRIGGVVGTIYSQGTVAGSGSSDFSPGNTPYTLNLLNKFGDGSIAVLITGGSAGTIGQIDVNPSGFNWIPNNA